ncbi:MAG: S8 family peptidase [Sulfuricellaceae bacterium]
MTDLPHLRLENTATPLPYIYPLGGGSSDFQLPPRDRAPHAQLLTAEIRQAEADVAAIREQHPAADETLDGVPITIRSDPGYKLPLESLERRREGIELLSARTDASGVTVANLFVQSDKIVNLLRIIQRYEEENDRQSGKPKNQNLVESIASIQLLAMQDLWQDDPALYPPPAQPIWWEVWIRRGDEEPAVTFERLRSVAQIIEATVSTRFVQFPERVVTLVYGTSQQLSSSLDFLAATAELRLAKEVPTAYLELAASDQREFVDAAVERLQAPSNDAPAVCLLDTGVNRGHPLIAPALATVDWQAVDPAWQSADHDSDQHGTGMAGVALYRCLTDVFTSGGPIQLRHRIESVKLLPPPPQVNHPDLYGSVTVEAVAKAEIVAPNRNRAICMAVTTDDDRDHGLPSSWSASIDQMCAGALDENPKLMFISTGNYSAVLQDAEYIYPNWNCEHAGVQDPSQAWNAMTVGGYTELVNITDHTLAGWNPIATSGDLSPTSRTSNNWSPDNQKGWPIKPDIVLEGGNYIFSGAGRDACGDLSILSTILHPTGRLLTHMRDTSAATAAAARAAAILWSHYPHLWPESVRALLLHSARWTAAMEARFPATDKASIQQRLRCYGYGVPNLGRAIYSAENAATMIFEGELQPFEKIQVAKEKNGKTTHAGKIKTKDMHLHELPWPIEVLHQLGEMPVTMRVTLSYFIEPSPNRKGWGRKYRFASHGLRFDVKNPLETVDDFKKRISKAAWEEDEERPQNIPETRNWVVGSKNRTHGSIHSDWWQGTATELAGSGYLAVYPVTGWWRERPHLGRLESKARYSLVISIETQDENINLYTPITNFATVMAEIVT